MTVVAKKKVLTTTCGKCSAQLSYEPSDVVHYEEGPFGPHDVDPYDVYAITCPNCRNERRVEYPGPGFQERRAKQRFDEE